jgi:fused signal recognition particle receptor
MGLFDKLKNLITRKKEVVEEVKDKYEVEKVEDIEEENIEEEAEESLEEEIENKEIEDEEIEAEEIEEPKEEIDDEEVEEEESVEEDEPEEEVEEESEDDDDEEWTQFVQSHQSKVEEAKDIETYDKGLEKTRKEFVSKLSLLGIKYNKVDDDYFDELEEILINADVGVNTVMKFIDQLRDRVKKEHITDTKYLNEVIIDELFIIYVDNQSLTDKINIAEEGPTVILFVGVNGVGKTTTIAKVAHKYRNEGKSVMMIAGDTFRAGAVDQLHEWADRTGSKFYGKEETDPAGVIFDGLKEARDNKIDIVLIDTAGRLQNKVNLMKELEKINNVIDRQIPGAPHETLLVIDATTGQNGISQAKAFKEITNITGIVLTKMDGTAKGGIVLAIKDEVDIPVKFIGLGEKMTDLKTFDIENYIYGLFKDLM